MVIGFHVFFAARYGPALVEAFESLVRFKGLVSSNKFSGGKELGYRELRFAMMLMATIHSFTGIGVCWLDMQVSSYQGVPQVDPHVEEDDFLASHKAINLMVRWRQLRF